MRFTLNESSIPRHLLANQQVYVELTGIPEQETRPPVEPEVSMPTEKEPGRCEHGDLICIGLYLSVTTIVTLVVFLA
jgi:hypothetical protein